MQFSELAKTNKLRASRTPIVEIVDLRSGNQTLHLDRIPENDPLRFEIEIALNDGVSRRVSVGTENYFLRVHAPKRRIVVVGAVHITQHLAPMASATGSEVLVIDPREAFASAARFPGATIYSLWPEEVFAAIQLDRSTAVIAVTHDPKIDDPAIVAALSHGCFYVGALGSRKTHAARLDRFQSYGFSREQLLSIRAPIGLDIGARSPAEIAVSILAEVIAFQAGRVGRELI
ncbi:XdhC/CoxF family protein (plasmid) [Rhizobium leguminosarum]|uniref:XdhC family protein n=1 Tax=Rhizobium leguminosarum TaxID=384 RepID=UPI0010301355|nr:XdhC family protein [Rhizobium leguminosarum]TAV45409.1 XdhC/CoxF family protein [Rhizobium leguminosarum]TAV45967.1 XdhC/CoxF family protein [Rhizobium leguminosarum]TAV63822.1 XdhC/CoxF family protein [Rhizobium leguminosarum]